MHDICGGRTGMIYIAYKISLLQQNVSHKTSDSAAKHSYFDKVIFIILPTGITHGR